MLFDMMFFSKLFLNWDYEFGLVYDLICFSANINFILFADRFDPEQPVDGAVWPGT